MCVSARRCWWWLVVGGWYTATSGMLSVSSSSCSSSFGFMLFIIECQARVLSVWDFDVEHGMMGESNDG